MTTFFTIDEINELVLQGHSYISSIGVKIIDDKNYKSSSILEGHFYEFLELLEVIELRKDVETTDDKLQQLVLRLYGFVENECVYYNGKFLDIDDPMFSGSVSVSGFINPATLGGPITSLPAIGFNPGAGLTAAQWIQAVFYQTEGPLASLAGGIIAELTAATTAAITLAWQGIRQAYTAALSSIVITGNTHTFTETFVNPAAPGAVGGNQNDTLPTNVSTTYTVTVTTVDGKTSTAITTQSYQPKRYWGRTALSTPDNTTILSCAGGANEFSNVKGKVNFIVTASGNNQIYYAYPSSEGVLTSLTIGGFESINSFTLHVISVTNALGYIQNYNVYVSNNTFSANTPNIVTI